MADFFEELEDKHIAFIEKQPMFFTATAAENARINLSPKGMDSFRVLGTNKVAYLDMIGSGNETAAHLLADGRITIMFCSFDRNALIMRLFGRGRMVQPDDPEWGQLIPHFNALPSIRQIMVMGVESVQTACGWGVPQMELVGERPTMSKWAENKGADGLKLYKKEKNSMSIDGLPTGIQV
ncbi:MAG: pyridoxamine 5'-phosphate oxidase family protein [Sphingomonadales bacterium]|jgi:hypothetical protein